jgi:hypothetical protein
VGAAVEILVVAVEAVADFVHSPLNLYLRGLPTP